MNIWEILVLVSMVGLIIGALIIASSTNKILVRIGWILTLFGIVFFIIGTIGSYYLLSATTKVIKGDPEYRKRDLERTEGESSGTGLLIKTGKED